MRHICDCANPPGGRVQCAAHQLAICYVDGNGGADKRCVDPPRKATRRELVNWALEQITGIRRSQHQEVTAKEADILRSGVFLTRTGIRVSFSLPEELRE